MNYKDPKLENENIIRKGYVSDKKEINRDERTVVAYGNTITEDSYKEVLLPDGWIFDRFAKNPTMPWSHKYGLPPVGRALWWKTDEFGVLFKGRFSQTAFGEEIWMLYAEEVLNAFSVGYEQLKAVWANEDEEEYMELIEQYNIPGRPRLIGVKQHLWEISPVVLPANADSLVTGVEDGLIKSKCMFDTIENLCQDEKFCEEIGHTKDLLIKIVESQKEPEKVQEFVDVDIENLGEGLETEDKEDPDPEQEDPHNESLIKLSPEFTKELEELKEIICAFSERLAAVEKAIKKPTEDSKNISPEISAEEQMEKLKKMIPEVIGGEVRKLQGKVD